MTERRRIDPWRAPIWLLFFALAGTYAAFALWRYDIFRGGVDDGTFTQIALGFPHAFSAWSEEGANHFLVHFSPILVLSVPFAFAFRGAPGLIVLQAAASASVVFPIWGLAAKRFSPPIAFAVTLVAALYPPLSAAGVGDFHETFPVPFLSAALVWAVDRRSFRIAIAAAVALVCSKEDQFVVLAFVGAVMAIGAARRDAELRRCGWTIAALAAGAALFYFGVLRPLINPKFPYWSLHFYQWWWFPETTNGFVDWNSPERLQYLVSALAPLAFLPVFSRYAIFAIPGLAEVLLSHERITMFIGEHYNAGWLGYVLCAFVDGAYALWGYSRLAMRVALVAAAGISIWTLEYRNPSPGFYFYRKPTAQDAVNDRVLRSLPAGASVWSDDWLYAHLATHPLASINFHGQEYVVLDRKQDASILQDNQHLKALIGDNSYSVALDSGGLLILRKNAR